MCLSLEHSRCGGETGDTTGIWSLNKIDYNTLTDLPVPPIASVSRYITQVNSAQWRTERWCSHL